MIDIHWYDSQSGINQIHLHKTICLWDINFRIWKERSHASSGDKVFPCNSSTHQQWKLHELNGNLQLIEDQNINRKHLQISTFPVKWWVCETQPKTSSINPSCSFWNHIHFNFYTSKNSISLGGQNLLRANRLQGFYRSFCQPCG